MRFRVKLGPLVYDEKLGGARDRRLALLTAGDLVALAFAVGALTFMIVMVVLGG